MLTKEEQKEIDEHIKDYPDKKAACLEALKVVQEKRRWISNESLKDIASYLEMTIDDLDGIATFYNLIFRQPVGEHVILICDSVSCYIMDYEKILDHLNKKLGIKPGETTKDKRFTLLPIPCLGTCDHAPALMIDNDLHQDLSEEKLDKILDLYR